MAIVEGVRRETATVPKIFTQTPCEALRPFVRCFRIVEYPAGHRDSHLPGTGLVAVFLLRGDCLLNGNTRVPPVALTGLWDTARTHDHSRGNAVALVQFTAVGAAAFLHRPLDEFLNSTVALDGALGRLGIELCLQEQLAGARNHSGRIRLLEEFLLARVADARIDPLISAAVTWIERAPPAGRIDTLARHIGLSQGALERRFRRVVGVTPRKFASIVRLQQVLHLHKAGHNLTSIAHSAGYFDQSHFIHDFRRFTGAAPQAYFAQMAGG